MLLGLRDPASVQQHSTLANLLSSQAQINHLCRSGGCDSPAKLEVKKGHINIETPLRPILSKFRGHNFGLTFFGSLALRQKCSEVKASDNFAFFW